MKSSIAIIICILSAASLYADSFMFPTNAYKVTEQFGDTKFELCFDPRDDQDSHMFELLIYKNDTLLSKYRNVTFTDIFASPDNKYFLGVSNFGIPGTAYVIFDNEGRLIKEVKHVYSDLKYSSYSLVLAREWYDKDNPDVEFHSNQWRLRSLQINSSSGERIELLKRNKLNN